MASAISKPFALLLVTVLLLLASSIMHVESSVVTTPATVYPTQCIAKCKSAIPTCIKSCFGTEKSTINRGLSSKGRSNSSKGGSNSGKGGHKYCIIPCKEEFSRVSKEKSSGQPAASNLSTTAAAGSCYSLTGGLPCMAKCVRAGPPVLRFKSSSRIYRALGSIYATSGSSIDWD
ncbi:hypothetical protein FRX31_027577 [Thalictrum thalictroides]|uniref:Uncharacterized protein n=1 Tax=Thalictrum thalictroides TaxID=46969 RepID=A0A7J6VCK1_THATH|nr:hypothetical protein FRX31_027577 [Thalictrum thalictroides]